MKILVIPDVHLKPEMFARAHELLTEGSHEFPMKGSHELLMEGSHEFLMKGSPSVTPDMAVCLGDLADDWFHETDLNLYEATYDAAIAFARKHPETLWCYGNHDYAYLWRQLASGYSFAAEATVRRKLGELERTVFEVSEGKHLLSYVHRIDHCLFSHGGLSEFFVNHHVSLRKQEDPEELLDTINMLGPDAIWHDTSPIWYRPQYSKLQGFGDGTYLQVVGHTPVPKVIRSGNYLSCDTFSTFANGIPIGNKCFAVVDTETFEYWEVK